MEQSGGRSVATTSRTPLTSRADRGDERVRLIEEAVLLIRGEWPGVACGLCETVNRATGLIITPRGALDETIERTAGEAIRVVEGLYGHEAAFEVRRLALSIRTPREPQPCTAPGATDGSGCPRYRAGESALAPASRRDRPPATITSCPELASG